MCGIAGFFLSETIDADTVGTSMLDAIRYRGRDDENMYTDPGVLRFCHARLAILDIQNGRQPMADHSGRYVIIQNGEIYNYLELRKDYEAQGARFHTQSDTEVILEGFKLKKAAVCDDLNGMFAFAIWDTQKRRLFLARDRMGKKPLYWTMLNGNLYFASTLDAFAFIPGWTGRLLPELFELQAQHGFLGLSHTVYEQARCLPPASYAWATPDHRQPAVTRYWTPDFSAKRRQHAADAMEECEALLTDAIRIRLRADVPLALTFSGGVDSGLIAALAAKKLNHAPACACIDYHTAESPSEETEIAVRTARHLELPLTHIQFDYHSELLPLLKESYRYFDQPVTQMAITYSLQLYKTIKRICTAALSGAGGDELFTGYTGNEASLRADKNLSPLQHLPGCIRHAIPEPVAGRLRILRDFPAVAANAYRSPAPVRQAVADELHAFMSACHINSHMDMLMFAGLYLYAADSNYRLPDVNGLQAQVEVRAPFLDYRLVEFAARLPSALKIGDSASPKLNKWLLKKLYERYVPADIAWAPKKGMGWNIRFDHAFVLDPTYNAAFEKTMKVYEKYGFNANLYRQAFETYKIEKTRDMASAPLAGNVAVTAFMQGQWLMRDSMVGRTSLHLSDQRPWQ